MAYVQHNGAKLYYTVHGDPKAPNVVMARGLGRSHTYWLGFEDLMAEHFRVLVFDNRGVGRSRDSRPAHSTRVLADDVAAVMDAAGFERAHYFGLSLAGMFGQWFGIRHPSRVRSLALGCTTAVGRQGTSWRVKWQLARCARMPLDQALDETARITLNPKFVETRPDILDTWRQIAAAEPPSRLGVVGQGFSGVTHDARKSLRLIQAPTS